MARFYFYLWGSSEMLIIPRVVFTITSQRWSTRFHLQLFTNLACVNIKYIFTLQLLFLPYFNNILFWEINFRPFRINSVAIQNLAQNYLNLMSELKVKNFLYEKGKNRHSNFQVIYFLVICLFFSRWLDCWSSWRTIFVISWFSKFFCFFLFEGTFTSFFKDIRSYRSHRTVGINVFLTIFAWW
jgi:hypothetical protein